MERREGRQQGKCLAKSVVVVGCVCVYTHVRSCSHLVLLLGWFWAHPFEKTLVKATASRLKVMGITLGEMCSEIALGKHWLSFIMFPLGDE